MCPKIQILLLLGMSRVKCEAVRDYVRESITALEATEQQLQLWVDNGRLEPSWTKLRGFLFATGLSIFVSVQLHPPSHYINLLNGKGRASKPMKQLH